MLWSRYSVPRTCRLATIKVKITIIIKKNSQRYETVLMEAHLLHISHARWKHFWIQSTCNCQSTLCFTSLTMSYSRLVLYYADVFVRTQRTKRTVINASQSCWALSYFRVWQQLHNVKYCSLCKSAVKTNYWSKHFIYNDIFYDPWIANYQYRF